MTFINLENQYYKQIPTPDVVIITIRLTIMQSNLQNILFLID